MKKFAFALLIVCLFATTALAASISKQAMKEALGEAIGKAIGEAQEADTEIAAGAMDEIDHAKAPETAKFHIGIMTGTVSQSEDELRGAELMLEKYGDVKDGGMITHITYPDNFMAEQETTVSQLAGLADDPLMKVIVVCQGIPGTTAGFRLIRERRPDILLFSGETVEDPDVATSAADLVTKSDVVNRGYLIPYTAKELGAKTLVHISFPRHMSVETLGRRRAIMEEACKDLGIKFVYETAPDPTSDVGVAGAQQFILEKMPEWVEKYGKDTAFYCTNDAQVEPLLKRVAELGAIFVEASLPSTLMGYPGAFNIDLANEKGNWDAILKKVEKAVCDAGGGGRMGTWVYSCTYTQVAALAEFGKRVVEGTAKLGNMKDLLKCYDVYTPGAVWNSSYWVDGTTGVRNNKMVMLYQDTYILGKGYMHVADVEVPEKYSTVKARKEN